MLLLALGFTAWQAMTVRSSLTAASERLSSTVDALGDGNFDAAATELDQARDTAGTARRHSRGPVWWAASKLPVIGDDVAAVRVISEVTDSLASRSLPDLVEAAKRFGPEQITPRGGRVDLEPVARVAPILAEGAQQIASADARVAELDPAGLVGALAGPVTDLQSKLARAARVSSVAATAAELMPAMLGSEGDRRYFLVFPNNAEIRAGGGMLGAHAVMQVRNGKPRIIEQGTPASLGPFTEDFIDLSADERKLFTTRLSVHPQNAAFLPDFPRTAQILTQMWEARRDADLDGMVSVDPVAMSYLLRATGPIALSNGQELTADNAVDYLLHGVYQSVPDGDTQNELYEEAARLVFEALLSDGVEPRTLLDALTQAVNEGRIKIWAADQREQQRLAGTTVAAELPVADGSVPEIGVYLNDAAADKLSYFLDYHVDVTPLTCSPEGRQVMDVEVQLGSTVAPDAQLSTFVIGPGLDGVPRGTLRNSVYFYAPAGGFISSAKLDGENAAMLEAEHHGRAVGITTLDLLPGASRTLTYRVHSGYGQVDDPRLITTPGARTDGRGEVAPSACS